MAPFDIYRFADSKGNIVTYTFNSDVRDEEGEGPVSLNRISETPDTDDDTQIPNKEPSNGTEIYRYIAKDGGDVRYQYDAGSRNGKDYVVAIHRPPDNWQQLMKEDLSVPDESKLHRPLKRHDSLTEENDTTSSTPEALKNDDRNTRPNGVDS